MKLYNSLSKKIEDFEPIRPPKVGLYTCGMTVYDFAHIGHGRKYVGDDILRRTLKRFGYDVTHVQNVTDVGHMSSDADEGEDKMEKGAKKYGKTVWELAGFYTDNFYASMDMLNVLKPTVICKATDHIPEQIALVSRLVEKGLAYDTPEAVYFDVTKFPGYASLFGRQKLEEKKAAVREAVKEGEHKLHPADFALWFKRTGRFANHDMHWESPWGDGFPGWHIECSAMSMKYLGDTIDIHTGGIDHIPVHHPNEIAQSEGATGKPFVRVWVHYNFLRVSGKKMSKSLENFFTIEDVIKKGFDPLSLRYFYLTSHYRSELNFTWESLQSAQNALNELRAQVSILKTQMAKRNTLSEEKMEKIDTYRQKFDDALANDMNTPQALAAVWEMLKSNISSQDKYDLLLDFDEVLGLKLNEVSAEADEFKVQTINLPLSHVSLATTMPLNQGTINQIDMREHMRQEKKYGEADILRKDIESKENIVIENTPQGIFVKKKTA